MDLIDRKQAIEVADAIWTVTGDKNVAMVWQQLQELPSAEKTGKWILVDEAEPRRYGCSCCKRLSYTMDNYCSYCGTRMVNDNE